MDLVRRPWEPSGRLKSSHSSDGENASDEEGKQRGRSAEPRESSDPERESSIEELSGEWGREQKLATERTLQQRKGLLLERLMWEQSLPDEEGTALDDEGQRERESLINKMLHDVERFTLGEFLQSVRRAMLGDDLTVERKVEIFFRGLEEQWQQRVGMELEQNTEWETQGQREVLECQARERQQNYAEGEVRNNGEDAGVQEQSQREARRRRDTALEDERQPKKDAQGKKKRRKRDRIKDWLKKNQRRPVLNHAQVRLVNKLFRLLDPRADQV